MQYSFINVRIYPYYSLVYNSIKKNLIQFEIYSLKQKISLLIEKSFGIFKKFTVDVNF